MKHSGILTCEEKIFFDGETEIWPVFCMEMNGVPIHRELLQLLSPAFLGVVGNTPPHLYFQSVWMVMIIKMAVNNLLLRWTVNEGNTEGICLCSWLKVMC